MFVLAWLLPVLGSLAAVEMAGSTGEALEDLARLEVVELHRFIEDWSNAVLADSDEVYARFSDALADDFEIVAPDGSLADREATVAGFRGAHGRWRGAPGRVRIEDVRVRVSEEPYVVLTYEEWHDLGAESSARLSTVVLRRADEAPGGVVWVHLHEVWIRAPGP